MTAAAWLPLVWTAARRAGVVDVERTPTALTVTGPTWTAKAGSVGLDLAMANAAEHARLKAKGLTRHDDQRPTGASEPVAGIFFRISF